MMKRLFCVKNNRGKVHANAYYGDKRSAKMIRDGLNKDKAKFSPYTISKGVDHDRYNA